MAFSLADSILRYHDPTALRPVAAPAPPGRAGPAGNDRDTVGPATTRVREEVAGIRSLLGEVSREWSDLLADVAELKRTMRPEDLEKAFAAAGLPALLRKGPARAPAVPGRRRVERAQPVRAGAETASAESPDVHARILEILGLLRENLGKNAASKGEADAVDVPESVKMEIAREVAGRVRDSLTTFPPKPGGNAAGSERTAPSVPKMVPLDDVNAIIDRITGLG